MYQIIGSKSIVLQSLPFPKCVTHSIFPYPPSVNRKSTSGWLRTNTIGISPLPGSPRAAPFGYRSIIIIRVCHRPPPRVTRVHLGYRFIAPSEKRDLDAPPKLGLLAHHESTQGMYLLNVYSIVSNVVFERSKIPFISLLGNFFLFERNFLEKFSDFFKNS